MRFTSSSLFALALLACGASGSEPVPASQGTSGGDTSAGAPSASSTASPPPASAPAASPASEGMPSQPAPSPSSPSAPQAPVGSVRITNDWNTFFKLAKPYGKIDEPGLGGFELTVSARSGFDANDQTINIGDSTAAATAIGADLGGTDISGVPFDFSIHHVPNARITFRLTNDKTGAESTLCWGTSCPAGSVAAATLNGQSSMKGFNGLQIQVRAQDISGSSTKLSNMKLVGPAVTSGSDPLFSGTATPSTASTIPIDPPGRIGQWILGTDLAIVDWELTGTVQITRPDAATTDTSKVRLVVDFVQDTRIPTAP